MAKTVKTFDMYLGEKLDFIVDLENWLDTGDTIDESVWTVTAGITTSAESKTDTTATIWAEAGTASTYTFANEATTVGGREKITKFRIKVVT